MVTETGTRALDFELPDLDGSRHRLRDLRGRWVVIFMWASWWQCRSQLPVWQRYRQGHPDPPFDLLAVAEDAALEDVRPWAERQALDFPVLVDADLLLPQQYGLRAVPNAIVIDPEGVVCLKVAGGFSINRPEHVAQLEAALGGIPSTAVASGAALSEEAARLFREGAALYKKGARQEAAARWRRAVALQPENFLIRKQLWRALHPERFGETLDLDWQKEQLAREKAEGIEAANPSG